LLLGLAVVAILAWRHDAQARGLGAATGRPANRSLALAHFTEPAADPRERGRSGRSAHGRGGSFPR
jgi:hypothetical protein